MAKFKKMFAALICTLVFTFFATYSPVMADQPIRVFVNGQQLTMDVNPVIEQGSTLVPFRSIFEFLGCTVSWDEKSQIVTGAKNNEQYQFIIDSNIYSINNTAALITGALPKIINGRTMVPLRVVGEALGYNVNWDPSNRTIYLTGDENITR